jgi:hypothetical protein
MASHISDKMELFGLKKALTYAQKNPEKNIPK